MPSHYSYEHAIWICFFYRKIRYTTVRKINRSSISIFFGGHEQKPSFQSSKSESLLATEGKLASFVDMNRESWIASGWDGNRHGQL